MSDDAPFGWEKELERERTQKDQYLATHPHSPIPQTERHDFHELEYFEPDPALRFEVPLDPHDEVETILVGTTDGGERRYECVGEFHVAIEGEDVTLQAFRQVGRAGEDRLWVPFRDATNSDTTNGEETNDEETYGGGRYLDLDDPGDRANDDGDWVLDFNRAYNPFCAYSVAYECALVPTENWLDVPVRAGEKAYEGASGYDGSGVDE